MAQPTISSFDFGSTTTNASSYTTTGAKAWTAGRLYIMFVAATSAASINDPTVFKLTTNGATFTKVRGTPAGSPRCHIYALRPGSNVASDNVTVTYGSQSITGFDFIIFEITGYLDTGTLSDAWGPNHNDASGNSGSPSAALTSAPTSNSRTLGFAAQGANAAFTAGAHFVKTQETGGHGSPNARAAGERDNNGSAETTADWTITSSTWIAMVVEIVSSTTPGDSGTGAVAVSSSRSTEGPVDGGTGAATATGSRATEGPVDSGTGGLAASSSRSFEATAESGTGPTALAGSRSFEATVDLGTGSTVAAAARSLEAVADLATASSSAGASGSEFLAEGSAEGPEVDADGSGGPTGDSQSGTGSFAISASGAEALADAAAEGPELGGSADVSLVDAGTVEAIFDATAIEGIGAASSSVVVLDASGVEGGPPVTASGTGAFELFGFFRYLGAGAGPGGRELVAAGADGRTSAKGPPGRMAVAGAAGRTSAGRGSGRTEAGGR